MKIYNTLTRSKDTIELQSGIFTMYCCGPTVYGPAHIGNFRTFIVQDTLRRVLELNAIKVKHVRNITDVDDKTIRESLKEGRTLKDFTKDWEDKFHKDSNALNLLPPTIEPRATEHIQEQVDMIQTLIDKGFAYVSSDGSVYFKISAFDDYGKLANLDMDNLKTQNVNSAGQANVADEYERESVSDFALWKGRKSEDAQNYWQAPWGEGRPGWHIECSAMARKYLGDSFDLHGGGIDLCFPHHENEIAQSQATTGVAPAKYWFHSAHLMVEGQKMSKSLGNLFRLDELLDKGYSANEIRYELLSGHYRQQLNFTFKGLDDARSALQKISKMLNEALAKLNLSKGDFNKLITKNAKIKDTLFADTFEALCDDLNIPKALGKLFSALPSFVKSAKVSDLEALGGISYALGVDFLEETKKEEVVLEDIPEEVVSLAEDRWQAKKDKNFALADEIRGKLTHLGWTILDKKDSYQITKS